MQRLNHVPYVEFSLANRLPSAEHSIHAKGDGVARGKGIGNELDISRCTRRLQCLT